MTRLAFAILAPSLLFFGYACSDSPNSPVPSPDAATTADAAPDVIEPTLTAISLSFEGRVGVDAFRCGGTYADVGTSHATVKAGDLRFFVHSIRLFNGGGEPVVVTLADRDPWQGSQVGLVDLEDKTEECEFGTTATNDVIEGSAIVGNYDTIEFEVGVPDALNHINVETAGAPFTASKLQWDWANGFIHFAAQVNSTAVTAGDAGASVRVPSFFSHLGSTACAGGDPVDGGSSSCARKNHPTVKLSGFNAQRDKLVVDLAKLWADSNIDQNTPDTIPGCMSGPNDPECEAVFARLGLDFATGAVSTTRVQQVFSVERR